MLVSAKTLIVLVFDWLKWKGERSGHSSFFSRTGRICGCPPALGSPSSCFLSVFTFTKCLWVFLYPPFFLSVFLSPAGGDLIYHLVISLNSELPAAPPSAFLYFSIISSYLGPFTCSVLGVVCVPVCSKISVSLVLTMVCWAEGNQAFHVLFADDWIMLKKLILCWDVILKFYIFRVSWDLQMQIVHKDHTCFSPVLKLPFLYESFEI